MFGSKLTIILGAAAVVLLAIGCLGGATIGTAERGVEQATICRDYANSKGLERQYTLERGCEVFEDGAWRAIYFQVTPKPLTTSEMIAGGE